MSRVLVTGGAGFLGSQVADALVRRGHDVTILDDLSGGFVENVPAAARFVRGTITDAALVDELFPTGRFEHVFHLAAYAAEGLSHLIKRFNCTNNVLGSVTLLRAEAGSGALPAAPNQPDTGTRAPIMWRHHQRSAAVTHSPSMTECYK